MVILALLNDSISFRIRCCCLISGVYGSSVLGIANGDADNFSTENNSILLEPDPYLLHTTFTLSLGHMNFVLSSDCCLCGIPWRDERERLVQ